MTNQIQPMMNGMTYDQFCTAYYAKAMNVADITIANQIKKNGKIHPSIDVDNVKTLGVTYALQKAFDTYDVDREKKASLNAYLSTLVHNCVLTELKKESTAVNAKNKWSLDKLPDVGKLDMNERGKAFRDYMQYDGRYERKEEVIAKLMKCVKKLNPVDQVIIECWMRNWRTYTKDALEELGWPEDKGGVVQTRRNRAMAALKQMMGGQKPDYRDIMAPTTHADYNAVRRRRRAAKAQITGRIDYERLGNDLYDMLVEKPE